jgi:hypothetical protein
MGSLKFAKKEEVKNKTKQIKSNYQHTNKYNQYTHK